MKRTPFYRKPPKVRPRAARPGVTPKMPKGWRALCHAVHARDRACRRCGLTDMVLPAIDHILPRRLFKSGAEASTLENLALLCAACHAYKTGLLEPAFYAGDILKFNIYLDRLSRTGPVPGEAMRAAALGRMKDLIYG